MGGAPPPVGYAAGADEHGGLRRALFAWSDLKRIALADRAGIVIAEAAEAAWLLEEFQLRRLIPSGCLRA